MANNFFLDNEDLLFNIEHQDWDLLFPHVEPDPTDPDAPRTPAEAVTLYKEFLNSLGEFIAEKLTRRYICSMNSTQLSSQTAK